ncbi:MAG: type I methionyl aminopeptidase [Elusimicrobia bacterium]|nr:type I methionyl aminopeptidase [Elusimicrobiota bacterium]
MPMTTAAIDLKSFQEIGWMREAGRVVAEVLNLLAGMTKAGISTEDLDRTARSEILKRKAKPAFLNYRGYPCTLCVSVNEEVVHGIPRSGKVLAKGDIVSLDLGAVVKGFYADAAVTVGVDSISEDSARLIEVTRKALFLGTAQVKPENRVGDISNAVQTWVESQGMSVVREFVGHGIGRNLHEEPPVHNYGRSGTGPRLQTGMVIAIEPMVSLGGPEVRVLEDGWTAVTQDGSRSAHFEHTIAVTKEGHEVLTSIA